MELHNMTRSECLLCGKESAYEHKVLVETLTKAGERYVRKYVTVKRCANCDAAKCPNPSCSTRTLKVNATNCPTCGVPLMPKGR
jgi:hypothetical protein